MKKHLTTIVSIALLSLACCSTKKSQQAEEQVKFETKRDSIDKIVKGTEEKYKSMTGDQLITELEAAALRGEETFNSGAFREIIKRKDVAPALFAAIKDTSRKEFFKLMALRKIDTHLYDSVKASAAVSILVDALENSTVFNGWGMPDHYWESSAKAIIAFGNTAKQKLERLLTDKRPAPVWGSEEAMEYEKYKYRVCDYALALLYAIDKNEKIRLPVSPEERDRIINDYKK